MITRSFGSNGQFRVDDWTEELLVIPNVWGTIGKLGIFTNVPVATHSVTFEEIIGATGTLIGDRPRGERANVGRDSTRKDHSFSIPHFPLDDYISPSDIQGFRAYGSPDEAEALAPVRTRKMEYLRRKHAETLEAARAQLLTAGTVYSPNGTVSQNWFTEFGVTQTVVDFVLGTAGTDIIAKCEAVIAAIQDNAGDGGQNSTGFVGLASPVFFAKLIAHANVKLAYTYYQANPGMNLLAQRLGGAATRHRTISFGGIDFIEMRDSYNGSLLITSGDCVVVPTGTDAFKTYFGPAHTFDLVHTLGEEVYMFETEESRREILIESESNHACVARRPATIIRCHSSN